MDFRETHERKREARPPRTLIGTALRTLMAGVIASGVTIALAIVYDGEKRDREFLASSTVSSEAKSLLPLRRDKRASAPQTEKETKRKRPGKSPPADSNSTPPAEPSADSRPSPPKPDQASRDVEKENDGEPISPSDVAPEPPKRTTSATLAGLLDQLEDSIVKIESGEEGELSGLGSGFVVDARGWVATNYHVVADTTAARVRFKNGTAYEIDGYLAVDPELDLAILKMRDHPGGVAPLSLAVEREPRRLAPVVAVGHPGGVEFSVFDGKVSRVLTTSQLPPSSQRNLRRMIAGRADHRWVQHTAAISEGNSGGPLLDEQGHVLGVNTWVDRQARFGYALFARHLRDMLDDVGMKEEEEVEPLRKYARKEARVTDLLKRLTAERINELYAVGERMGWRPETAEDYEALRELAWAVTVIQLPDTFARGSLDDRLDQLGAVADRVVKRLAARRWDAVGQVTLVNEIALEQIDKPLAGVFLFGIVERTVEGDAGERGALVRVAGSNQMLFLPLDDQLTVPAPGLQCLILGVNYDGHRVRYGDNPLKLITAHVIATRTILPLTKPAD
jgi:S1-C subfamily serine protease